jgi:2-polyprenyl-6-methoxyphenol hydroxylase-like FAD-dependent oxidoreductase
VVGGGIGGLTAAAALLRVGWHVTVLERAAALADVGAGISLFPNAMRALDAIGVGTAVRAVGAPPPESSGGLWEPDGHLLIDATGQQTMRDLLAFHRADLHRALRESLPPGVLRLGAEAERVDDAGTAVRVHLAGGSVQEADLVIAADGLRSRIRAQLWPQHAGSRYAGYTSWRAVTKEPVPVTGAAGETWGRGERFGLLPLADGCVYWFAVANRPPTPPDAAAQSPAGDGALTTVRRTFGHWHDPIPALLAATAADAVLHHDIHDLVTPLPPFARGRIALLGDAAHAMTPDLGQGACQAIEDAVTLAGALADGPGSVAAALERYDRERRPRTQGIVKAARRTGRFAQAQGPLAVRARRLALRLTPPSAALRMAGRVVDWTPPALPPEPDGGATGRSSNPAAPS